MQRHARREATPPLQEDGYHSLLVPATIARAMLSLAAAVGLVCAAALTADTLRVDDPIVTLQSTEIDLDAVARAATGAFLVVLALTGVTFVTWAVLAYRNLPALAIEERRYWTIWLIVGWVIPGANLLVPKLVVDDLWRGSSPDAGIDGGDAWQRRPVASIVNRWWYSFLTTPAIAYLGVVLARGGLDEFDQQLAVGGAAVAASISIVVAAIAARRMVAVVTVAQARRADVIVDIRDSRRSAMDHLLSMERSRT
ncbi:DUF4328 domain-containing protein [Actinospongicola halichondriae]|uniref:DUF4328 domain-containing protein n=1 Tax=Actinospongicola halichondriae TaxID=3236844 RepID=UPI003D39C4F5